MRRPAHAAWCVQLRVYVWHNMLLGRCDPMQCPFHLFHSHAHAHAHAHAHSHYMPVPPLLRYPAPTAARQGRLFLTFSYLFLLFLYNTTGTQCSTSLRLRTAAPSRSESFSPSPMPPTPTPIPQGKSTERLSHLPRLLNQGRIQNRRGKSCGARSSRILPRFLAEIVPHTIFNFPYDS